MKVFIVGHKGWIGQKFINIFNSLNISYSFTDEFRGESPEILNLILSSNITNVLCCMGRTHGFRDNQQFNTIDYLEHPSTLKENINDNLFVPLNLALFCQNNNIHFTYLGTGCIFNYDENHAIHSSSGFNEQDIPNFFGSNYSIVKGFTDRLMHQLNNTLNLRIRMPITDEDCSRNFITKITNYSNICSIPNSMSVLNDLLPVAVNMMIDNETGTYNLTNPGVISHNQILEMYRDIINPNFKWNNFTIDEQDQVLLSKRSNNYLETSKLKDKYVVKNIEESVRDILYKMKENRNL